MFELDTFKGTLFGISLHLCWASTLINITLWPYYYYGYDIFLTICFYYFNYLYMRGRQYALMNAGTHRAQRFLWKLGLQAVITHLMWVLGFELSSSGRAVCALNHWAPSPAWDHVLRKQDIRFSNTFLIPVMENKMSLLALLGACWLCCNNSNSHSNALPLSFFFLVE